MDAVNTIKILLATDNHLGYKEGDPIRGQDSFETFEEILKMADTNDVDFILLCGDLYHYNKPSKNTLNESIKLIRKYSLGHKKISFDCHYDIKGISTPQLNYESGEMNVKYPIFTIYGNHDDPTGPFRLCSLEILSNAGLVNLFGKYEQLDQLDVYPLLFHKNNTNLAIYSFGYIRDRRLYKMFDSNRINFVKPTQVFDGIPDESYVKILILHQNRSKHSNDTYVKESFLKSTFDFVIFGHEHDCRIIPENSSNGEFLICQPGSSVATSLAEGESKPKHVGILDVTEKSIKFKPVLLNTVRP